MKPFYVILFGILGVLCRFGTNELAARFLRHAFPTSTLLINVVGSFAIGCVYVLGQKAAISESLRVGLMVGFLGGFTTFSAFALEALMLIEGKQNALALIYLLGSPALGLLAAWAGVTLTRSLT